jgi:ABC-type nitrate/sulfonate/bicarbonate transport system permease component
VWRYLVSSPDAHVHRSVIFAAWRTTLGHALLSLLAGMGCAVVAAVVFVLYRPLRGIGMPTALALQCVPLIAFVPVITVLLGRGTLGVAAIGAVVVGAPSLIMVMSSLDRTSAQALDVVRSGGGNGFQAARFVRLPAALPGIFGAARIGAPLAIMAALIMEWLAVGGGLGSYMTRAGASFDYGGVWSAVVVMTITSIVFYAIASAAERWALGRFSG